MRYTSRSCGLPQTQISIAAGTPGAIFYTLGAGVSKVINSDNPNYNVIVEQTGGARENTALLLNKRWRWASVLTT
jgi:TRAP-type uncharacterized transport system substrate-binding protein